MDVDAASKRIVLIVKNNQFSGYQCQHCDKILRQNATMCFYNCEICGKPLAKVLKMTFELFMNELDINLIFVRNLITQLLK